MNFCYCHSSLSRKSISNRTETPSPSPNSGSLEGALSRVFFKNCSGVSSVHPGLWNAVYKNSTAGGSECACEGGGWKNSPGELWHSRPGTRILNGVDNLGFGLWNLLTSIWCNMFPLPLYSTCSTALHGKIFTQNNHSKVQTYTHDPQGLIIFISRTI